MKFESPHQPIAGTRNEECLRKFLSGNKIAFAQAFWENGPRKRPESEGSKVKSPLVPGFEDSRN
ncbi:hypothetical protein [Pelagicoccus mobilis]|uniref:Uncharacterized protein n=1 Tax=Pelagicoccus mobilis TaxID=415221 RepID=A0A934RVU8_9BACT|nr:hypothetical protein [Pelagicoccus mobilis]MBK1877757.1 hypothetical protein [Pelagicoccus mobilis]